MVTIAKRIHLYPYRTQKLSSLASKILGWRRPGKIESCHLNDRGEKEQPSLFYPYKTHSPLAQSVEHAAVNRGVVGSSPTRGAKAPRTMSSWGLLILSSLFTFTFIWFVPVLGAVNSEK